MIFDGHVDIFTDVTIRRLKGETNVLEKHHLDRLFRKGKTTAATFVLWVDPPYTDNPSARLAQVMQAIEDEMKECKDAKIVTNVKEIKQAEKDGKLAIMLGMEGISGIDNNVERLYELYDFGVRQVMLTWNEANSFATGALADPNRGLTELGKKAIDIIQEKKMILDVSHLNEKSFWDIIDYSNTPILASHSNASAITYAKRNLTDDQLLAIKETKGLVGLNSFRPFIGATKEEQNTKGLLRHAAYIAEKIGVESLAFGFDFFEFMASGSTASFVDTEVSWIDGLEDSTKVPQFLVEMKEFGFSDSEIQAIAHDNWLNLIARVIG